MNAQLVDNAPAGEFATINPNLADWKVKLMTSIAQEKIIRYDQLEMLTGIPREIELELGKRLYVDKILKEDESQHFLVPKSYYTGEPSKWSID